MNTLRYSEVYSATQKFAIQEEFKRIEGQCYLDHAGATLYGETQIRNITKDLTENVYGNPHSINSTSKLTNDAIDIMRSKCLKHFNTTIDEYSLIFTSGTTAALKLIAESFNYKNGCLAYLEDNHTSVLGMRAYAPNVRVIQNKDVYSTLNCDQEAHKFYRKTIENNSLFVLPAQSNFCGAKYPLSWIESVQNGILNGSMISKWFCCLDAAAFVSTNELDLGKIKPDFVCISFYKIFGYPSGLGALLVKNDSAYVLEKKYYGGGTVLMTMSNKNIAVPRNVLHSRFEDGTVSYLSILSLKHGFEALEKMKLNMDLISKYTFGLAQYTYYQLRALHHSNGNPVAIVYRSNNFKDRDKQGAIINFNLIRPNGEFIGYAEVSHIANLFGIQLRTGCFCNPGACQRYLGLSSDDVLFHFSKGHVCGDQYDLIEGTPTGSVRISFGYMSSKENADDFLKMIEDCFVIQPTVRKYITLKHEMNVTNTVNEKQIKEELFLERKTNSECTGILKGIYLYPIKSCGFITVAKSWKLESYGLKYDREFILTNERGVCLTQKNNTDLCKIKPLIDVENNTLQLTYEDRLSPKISFENLKGNKIEAYKCQTKVCGDFIEALFCGNDISKWLSDNLELDELKLLRQSFESNNTRTKERNGESSQVSLVNEAQFLLINRSSIEWLWSKINKTYFTDTVEELTERFRPNLVVDFKEPFVENDIKEIHIGDLIFKNIGKCTRCQMICVNQNTGEKTVEPLRTLSKEFGGKISFGIYLKRVKSDSDEDITVNSKVIGFS